MAFSFVGDVDDEVLLVPDDLPQLLDFAENFDADFLWKHFLIHILNALIIDSVFLLRQQFAVLLMYFI